jgi:ATP-binding cassette subfamily F protein uup
LDIDTLELLESLLQDFPGTLFLVSHDRAFLENTVTQVFAFEGEGKVTEFGGGYDDWLRFSTQRAAEKAASEKTTAAKTPSNQAASSGNKSNSKLNYKEQKELEALPGVIEQLELEQVQIQAALAGTDIYKDQPDLVKTYQSRLSEIEEALMQSLERWEMLESRRI